MKNIKAFRLLFLFSIIFSIILGFIYEYIKEAPVEEKETPQIFLTHKQEVWLNVLEWCESRGNPKALNKIDRDGTPSYGAYQFKPGTFISYWRKYDLPGYIPANFMDQEETREIIYNYNIQRAILENMINDKTVNWKNEFPDCVKKYGKPPTMLQ